MWFAPNDDLPRHPNRDWIPGPDFPHLFDSTPEWSARTDVFEISPMMGSVVGPEDELHRIGSFLSQHHIAQGAEGYGLPATVETFAKRIQSLGGSLDYVAMDEPVWFGHAQGGVVRGVVRCQDSLADLVVPIAAKIAILRHYFPNVQIGDIDPINASPYATSQDSRFVSDIIALADLLQQKTGMKLAFVHADIAWTTKWQPMVESLASQLHKRGIRFGVICDGGGPNVNSSEAWVRQALQRCRAMAANQKTIPDDLIVQSWEPLPAKMLPETDPGSLTYEASQLTSLVH